MQKPLVAGDELAHIKARLQPVFLAALGVPRGDDALAAALEYAWRHPEVLKMDHPLGYLFRVGKDRTRLRGSGPIHLPLPTEVGVPWVESELPASLARLTERQRLVVVLTCAFQWTQEEVAELLGLSRSTIQNHLERALDRLRSDLKVNEPKVKERTSASEQ